MAVPRSSKKTQIVGTVIADSGTYVQLPTFNSEFCQCSFRPFPEVEVAVWNVNKTCFLKSDPTRLTSHRNVLSFSSLSLSLLFSSVFVIHEVDGNKAVELRFAFSHLNDVRDRSPVGPLQTSFRLR